MSVPARALRARSLLPGLVGGVAAAATAAQPWFRATGEGVRVGFTGTVTTAGLAQALAVVALAGWLLVLVLGPLGRRVLGVLLALDGAGVVLVGLLRTPPSEAAVQTRAREVSLAAQLALEPTGWPWGYVAAGLAVLAGGVAVAVTAHRWPRRADRFERHAAVAAVRAEDDPAAVWKAQDAGLDPTAHEGAPDGDARPGAPVGRPDSSPAPTRGHNGAEPARREGPEDKATEPDGPAG